MARCSSCGKECEINVPNRVNLKDSPDLKEKVRDGSLFVWECPSCGSLNLYRGEFLYHDPDNHLMFFLLPPGSLAPENEQALEAQAAVLSESLPGYVLRRVDDVGTLIEKVNIFDCGLDDCVIEMCKYITRMEMSDKGTKDILDASLKFYRMEGADNDLVFTYPSEGTMQCIKTGFNVYEDCAGIIRRNPAVKPAQGFARIDPDWVSRFFR